MLAVCAGFQLIGTSLVDRRRTQPCPGSGLIDAVTTRAPKRLGRRSRGARRRARHRLARRLREPPRRHRRSAPARCRSARGSPSGAARPTASCSGRVVGTYLHGPVLARNPRFADHLLEWVAGPLEPFADPQAELLHEERYAEVTGARSWSRRLRRPSRAAELQLANGRGPDSSSRADHSRGCSSPSPGIGSSCPPSNR